MVHALVDMIALPQAVELVVGVHIDAAHGVDESHEGREVHPDIIIQRHIVQCGNGIHGSIDAVDAGVGQFVPGGSGDIRKQDEIVTGRIGHEDGVGLGIHRHDHVDIASAGRGDLAQRIDTGNVKVKGLIHGTDMLFVLFRFGLHFRLDLVLIQYAHLVQITFHVILDERIVCGVIYRRIHILVHQCLAGFDDVGELFHRQVLLGLFFHIGLHAAEVLCILRGIHGKGVVGGILNGLGLVFLADDHHHVVHLILGAGDFPDGIVYLINIEIDHCQEQEQQQAQQKPDDLHPAFFSAHDEHGDQKQQEQCCAADDEVLQRYKSGDPDLIHQKCGHQKLQQAEEESQAS